VVLLARAKAWRGTTVRLGLLRSGQPDEPSHSRRPCVVLWCCVGRAYETPCLGFLRRGRLRRPRAAGLHLSASPVGRVGRVGALPTQWPRGLDNVFVTPR
jgi:hypothetical protein